jgi:DNA-binding IclR family transcriptional regulator
LSVQTVEPGSGAVSAGTQTLTRALDIIDAVAGGVTDLPGLSKHVGITRSTTHRLAAALVARQYLRFTPRQGYRLGPRLLELGFKIQHETQVPRLARPHLEALSVATEDTVHLGVLDGDRARYLDKVAGQRRIEIGSRVGELHPIWSTGLGKALILDKDEATWRRFFDLGTAPADQRERLFDEWRARMREYAQHDYAFDLEENEFQIRCVAAPIRDGSRRIVAAISVSSARQYMDEPRMRALVSVVLAASLAISRELGWSAA